MLCQVLDMGHVLPMIGRVKQECPDSMAHIYGTVAKAAAILGDWSVARKYAGQCAAAMESEAQKDLSDDPADECEEVEGKQLTTGGKRGWGDMEEARKLSLKVYLKIIRLL
jgi:hypothetical protein